MLKRMIWLCALWLCWSATAHAQTACPPGLIPYAAGAGGGVAVCGPAPTDNQQPMQRPPLWADRWGAVAAEAPGSPPAFGSAVNMASKRAAETAALADCQARGTKCQVALIYHNQCVAIVGGEKGWTPFGGPTIEIATQKSMNQCRADGSTQCKLDYSACSYPERIQ